MGDDRLGGQRLGAPHKRLGPAHEMHRDYFQREMLVGRRVVAQWSVHERWPDYGPALREVVIDGFEFRTEEDASRFNLDAMTSTPPYDLDSWEDAEEWVHGD